MLTLNQYQEEAWRTGENHRLTNRESLAVHGLGIAGEAGEVADMIKKWFGHDHPLDDAKLVKELGDVLWYVSTIAKVRGINLETVARLNIEKLRRRYPEGFTTERSLNREEYIHPDSRTEDGRP